MLRLPWKRGREEAIGRVYVSASRFTYRRVLDLPMVLVHGVRMRAGWAEIEGAVGVFLAGDVRSRTTYTISAWRADADLRRWLRSPAHARAARTYGRRLESSLAVGWDADAFEPRAAWREGLARLRAG